MEFNFAEAFDLTILLAFLRILHENEIIWTELSVCVCVCVCGGGGGGGGGVRLIIFDFSGLDAKDYLDKPRLCQFHLKVEGQALLFSQAVLRVGKYEFGSFSLHTVQNCLTRYKIPLAVDWLQSPVTIFPYNVFNKLLVTSLYSHDIYIAGGGGGGGGGLQVF